MDSSSSLSSPHRDAQTSNLQQTLTSPPNANQTQIFPAQATTEQPQEPSQNNAQSTTTLVSYSTLENYPHQVNGAGGPTATAPFLRDFSLVAEAAKRAQMAVVMRDLEGVTL
ncbi:hypothetical protein P175DRAFT_0500423 [Aspergillus ochraceoroseus IBT 24754]|uniref:Uncharacterized protein n=3 Tax=Aspergillus subgen. Nidulantes TaxID=2720870 RepID=A0A0F8UN42_9EURO|nr:uncharacterized protein P175DRAFT_0500423 [Aspergillus ochraceoroseus IBT 24754]KKK20838.1 hypothetical protein AOCH_006557 [Aspergillus ochraceoroseus]KKK20958.1 hypothetical protein ARAM_006424 [Aspergillus rambellii]PTU21531.1 hypothetical protein P175DRAFT_0500423 [Aspergillus ochraceoroseus IBT 24754]